jgi:hypothetical protein
MPTFVITGPKAAPRWAKILLSALVGFALWLGSPKEALAQMGMPLFEVTLSGSYEERFSQFKTNQRRSWSAELVVPLTSFFQFSAGHSFLEAKDIFNDEYREFQRTRGVELPEGPVESIETYIDTTVNGVLYQNFGYVRPSIFGGALWRTYCEENSLADYGCKEQEISWNAGAGLSLRITTNLRLSVTYRVTPSVTHKDDERLDTLTSLGLTIAF